MNLNENYMYLFEDTLLEDLDRRQKRRWKIVLLAMKYIDIKSYKEAYPEDKDLSRKQIVKKLRDRLNRLPEETKLKLINNKDVVKVDNEIVKRGKGNGSIVAGSINTAVGATAGAGAVAASHIGGSIVAAGVSTAGTATAADLIVLPFAALGVIGLGAGVGLFIKAAHTKRLNKKAVKMMDKSEILAEIEKEKQLSPIVEPKKEKVTQEKPTKKLTPKLA